MKLPFDVNIDNLKVKMEIKKLYIITGISGHLGRNIAYQLLEKGELVRGFVLPHDSKLNLDSFPHRNNLEIIYGNILNKDEVNSLFCDIGDKQVILIHCAGLISIEKKMNQKVYDVNVNGTKIITDAAIKYKIHKYIYVSSVDSINIKQLEKHEEIKEFNEHLVRGCYAKTKAISSAYVLSSTRDKINTSIVLPSGILGPNDYHLGHLNELIVQYLNGDIKMIIRGGYDMVDVRDVASGIIACADKGGAGECYVLSNQHYSILSILDTVSEITGQKRIKTKVPKWLVLMFSGIVNLYYKMRKKRVLFTAYSLKTIRKKTHISHKKADLELGYKTRDIKETLIDTINWFK